MSNLTLFSFGYHGWGTHTDELVWLVDAAERKAGFKPPIFVDTRLERNVRASGFRGEAFEDRFPGRYKWMPELGNVNIKIGGPPKLQRPGAVKDLLDYAVELQSENRRVIFFCHCHRPGQCHRRVVAKGLLREAKKRDIAVEVVEWPGGSPERYSLKVPDSLLLKVAKSLNNLPLEKVTPKFYRVPWMSSVVLTGNESGAKLPILVGPVSFYRGFVLPILAVNSSMEELEAASGLEKFRQQYEPLIHVPHLSIPTLPVLVSAAVAKPGISRALSLRQPHAEEVMQGRKRIEYRSWRTRKQGERVFIYASPQPEPGSAWSGIKWSPGHRDVGVIVGSVIIDGCSEERNANGLYEFYLSSPERLPKPLKPTRTPQPRFFKPFEDEEN